MATVEFFTIGGSDIAQAFFNTVVTTVGTSAYDSLLKMAFLAALVGLAGAFIIQRDLMVFVKWLGLYFLAINIAFTPKVTVQITDMLNKGEFYTVDNVPLGLGVVASLSSRLGQGLIELIESNFHFSNDLSYQDTGMVFGATLVSLGNRMTITDPQFAENLQEFMQQCVFYDLLLQRYTWDDMINSDDLWGFLKGKASQARAFRYNDDIVVCDAGATSLASDWKDALETAQGVYAKILFGDKSNAKELLLQYLPLGYQFLSGLSQDASKIMQQTMMANLVSQSVMRMGATVGAPAALELFAFERAQTQKRLTDKTLGQMAAHWLPMMKVVFELLLIGAFVLVLPLALLPIGWRVIKNYAISHIYIQTWGPLFVMINLIVTYYGQQTGGSLGSDGLTMANLSRLSQVNEDISTLAGYLSFSVIFLAGFLTKGLSQALHSMAYTLGGLMQSASITGASEAASGNISLGNTQLETTSAYNTQAHQVNANASIMSGAVMGQMPGGSVASHFPGGEDVLNTRGAISDLGTQVNFSESLRTTASQQAEHSESAALNNLASSNEHINAMMREGSDYAEQQAQFSASGESGSINDHVGFHEAVQDVMQSQERYGHDQEISHQEGKQKVGTGYWGVHGEGRMGTEGSPYGKALTNLFGFSISGSASGGYKKEYITRTSDDTQQRDQEAEGFNNDMNFNKGFDYLYRQAKEVSARQGEDETTRFATSIVEHLDQAKQYREEAVSQFSQADSYRKLASLSEEEAINFNSNASQPFKTWLLKQPSSQGQGQMSFREIESIAQKDPVALQQLAGQFVKEQTPDMLAEFARANHIQPEFVQQQHQQNQESINRDAVTQAHADYKAQVQEKKESTDWRTVKMSPLKTVPLSIKLGRDNLDSARAKLKTREQEFKAASPFVPEDKRD